MGVFYLGVLVKIGDKNAEYVVCCQDVVLYTVTFFMK